jgi:hypothetical protein
MHRYHLEIVKAQLINRINSKGKMRVLKKIKDIFINKSIQYNKI